LMMSRNRLCSSVLSVPGAEAAGGMAQDNISGCEKYLT
jgi:hypothetical protein